MTKYFCSAFLALALLPFLARADVGEAGSGQRFTGTITAIETERDSITVENREHIVKMFSVTPATKSGLQVGQNVTVTYTNSGSWPLKSSSVSGAAQ